MSRLFKFGGKIMRTVGAFLLVTSVSLTTLYADTAEEIRDEAKEDLENTNDLIDDITDLQEKIAEDLDSAAVEMEGILESQSVIAESIVTKQAEIDTANAQLVEAQNNADEEYEAMKLRIQYMYENSSNDEIYSIILDSKSVAEVLSRIEYFQSVYEADRRLMGEYTQSIKDVENLQVQLAKDMEALMDLQEEYAARQTNLQVYTAELGKEADSYASQLATAKEQVEEYEAIIAEQERIIREQEAAAAKQNAANYSGGGSGASGLGTEDYLTNPDCDPSFTSNVTGEELVEYALQFVGNPYKWGGNSLTEGCDCSGFVKLIYAHFGFDTPRYSQAFKTYGEPVAFENIKAGDIVVYPGHVAIYIGNGCIVEAQSTATGITCNRLVDSHTILAIRRVL